MTWPMLLSSAILVMLRSSGRDELMGSTSSSTDVTDSSVSTSARDEDFFFSFFALGVALSECAFTRGDCAALFFELIVDK